MKFNWAKWQKPNLKPRFAPIAMPIFQTKVVGQTDPDDLAIFVDLDVQRDMEAHALSNTRVELGGVLLGRQFIDHAGKPFVVISDCLRATHFEAYQRHIQIYRTKLGEK